MPLYYIYKIISLKLKGVNKELTLQIAVKAVNNFCWLKWAYTYIANLWRLPLNN